MILKKYLNLRTLIIAVWTVVLIFAGLLTGLLIAEYSQNSNGKTVSGIDEPIKTLPATPAKKITSEIQKTANTTPSAPVSGNILTPEVILATNTPEVALAQASCNRPERVLLISIDGLRADAVWDKKAAPYILDLALKQGAYTWMGLTVKPSITLPGHAAMLTGYDVPKTGVDSNELYLDGSTMTTKSIFGYAKDLKLYTVLLSGKKQMAYFNQPGVVDEAIIHKRDMDETVARDAIKIINDKNFGLMVINFGYTDIIGHDKLWMSPEYLTVVGRADNAVKSVLEALQNVKRLDTTLVIITSDHGGEGDHHGENRPADLTTPWVITGPCVKKGVELSSEPRLRIFDTAATILWTWGVALPTDLDGTPIIHAFIDGAFNH
jgi:predicted AlkP superfamily pyrophosphatase or phosphodiesterase